MTNKVRLIGIAVLMLVSAAVLVGGVSAADNEKLIHVSGTGSVSAAPDQVEISITVETEDKNSRNAQQDNARIMDNCLAALKSAGLSDKEITTGSYSMYSYTAGSSSLFGTGSKVYRVDNRIVIKTNKLESAGDYIDIAAANGANIVDYVRFSLSDTMSSSLRSKALNAAVAQAKLDADITAAALGVQIMGVYNVNVGSSYTPYRYAETAAYNKASMVMDSAAGAIEYSTNLMSEEIDVTASVSVDYIIR